MPTPRRPTDASTIGRKMQDLGRAIADQSGARRLQSATIDQGGLRIKNQGDLRVEGGNLEVRDGGAIDVLDGGDLNVRPGGTLRGYHLNGTPGALFGPLTADATGTYSGVGLLIQDENADDVLRAKTDETGTTSVIIGETEKPIDDLWFLARQYWLRCDNATGTGNAAPFQLSCAGEIGIYSQTGRLRVPWTNSSAAANVALDADGIIQRVSSARKYKQDIEDYAVDPDDVLALRPRTWRDRGEVERDPDVQTRYVGFIAEEVHDAGLTDLVVYDADGNPDALSYDRFTAALLQVVQAQQRDLHDLRERVAELERRPA